MRLYLAGPITANPEADRLFKSARDALTRNGYDVVNPMSIEPGEYFSDYAAMTLDQREFAQLKADLIEMLLCDGIATLPLSHSSRGTARELAIAFSLDLHVRPVGDWLKMSSIGGNHGHC